MSISVFLDGPNPSRRKPAKCLVMPGRQDMHVHVSGDGLLRIRCPFCNAYDVLDPETIDVTVPLYITHAPGCRLDAHIHNPEAAEVPVDEALQFVAELRRVMEKS